MGEIAEDFYLGRCCSGCSGYFDIPDGKAFEEGHGYPVLCEECWKESSKEEREPYSKSLYGFPKWPESK